MADYSIPTYPTKRLRYYNNQFLRDQDFIDDQAQHISRTQAHLRSLCVAGVCEGLNVTVDANKLLQVSAGLAIDPTGELIALTPGGAGPSAAALADGPYLVHISFLEKESTPSAGGSAGTPGNTRWEQAPALGATKVGGALPTGAVVLGTFTVASAAVTGVTNAGRQYSGVRFPGVSTTTPTLTNRGDAVDAMLLAGELTIRRVVDGGNVGPTLRLTNGTAFPGGANSGAAIDIDAYDPAGNLPAVRIQALGDNSGSADLSISTKVPNGIANGLAERLRVTSNGLSVNGLANITATAQTWGGWYEAIRFSRPDHSAITFPAGHLQFGMHSDRNFYFSDTQAGVQLAVVSPTGGGRLAVGGNGPAVYPLHVRTNTADWQVRFENPSSGANAYFAHGGGYGMHVRADTNTAGNYLMQAWNQNLGGEMFHVLASGETWCRGTLTALGGISIQGSVPHVDADGSFYRNTDGQVYITVDDHLYVRKSGTAGSGLSGAYAAHFDTSGNLDLKGNLSVGAITATSITTHGYGMLTDPSGSFNCHFPYNSNDSYVTGNNIILRGGAPTGWNEVLRVQPTTGRVGVGTNAPQDLLHVSGGNLRLDFGGNHLRFTNIYTNVSNKYFELESAGSLWGVNMWLSQRAAKKNIVALREAVDVSKIYQLKPSAFHWKDDSDKAPQTIGLIAEEVEAVMPQLVLRDGDGKPLAVDYSLLAVMLLDELQRLRPLIESVSNKKAPEKKS